MANHSVLLFRNGNRITTVPMVNSKSHLFAPFERMIMVEPRSGPVFVLVWVCNLRWNKTWIPAKTVLIDHGSISEKCLSPWSKKK